MPRKRRQGSQQRRSGRGIPTPAREVYPNAPLKEAAFEIRFPGELKVEAYRHRLQERIQAEFPNLKVPINEPEHPPLLKWYQLEKLDGTEAIRVGINFLSYLCLNYQGFAQFKKRIISIIQPAAREFGVTTLNRLGLRYINQIPMSKQKGVIPIEQFLNVRIGFPDAVPSTMEQLSLAVEVRKSLGSLRMHMQYIEQPAEAGFLLLDFDYYSSGPIPIKDLAKCLDRSHQETKTVFESLITNQYRRFLRGEVQ